MSSPAPTTEVIDADLVVTTPSRLPRLKPRDRKVAELHWDGLSNREVGEQLHRRPETVAKILRQPDVRGWLAAMDEKGQARLAANRVGARAILRASEEEFASTFVQGVRDARRPMDKVIAGEKGLGLLGIVAPKEIHQTLELKLAKVSDEALQAWAEGGPVPVELAADYAQLPPPPAKADVDAGT